MSDKIDVTVPCTLRPDILRTTLNSFVLNLFGSTENLRLILHVDEIGEEGVTADDMLDVAYEFFDEILLLTSSTPNFPKAVKTLWSFVCSDVFFHLEDDWKLLRKIDFQKMVKTMREQPNIALLRLPIFKVMEDHSKNWKFVFPKSKCGNFFECNPEDRYHIGFCGHPSLVNRKFTDEVLDILSDAVDPERFLKGKNYKARSIVGKWRQGVFSEPNQPPAIIDIGRHWRKERGWTKGHVFQTWTKEDPCQY